MIIVSILTILGFVSAVVIERVYRDGQKAVVPAKLVVPSGEGPFRTPAPGGESTVSPVNRFVRLKHLIQKDWALGEENGFYILTSPSGEKYYQKTGDTKLNWFDSDGVIVSSRMRNKLVSHWLKCHNKAKEDQIGEQVRKLHG